MQCNVSIIHRSRDHLHTMANWYQNTLLILVALLNSSILFVSSNSGAGNATEDYGTLPAPPYNSLTSATDPSTANMMTEDSLEFSTSFIMSTLYLDTALISITDNGAIPMTPPTSGSFDTTRVPGKSNSQEIFSSEMSSSTYQIHVIDTTIITTQMFSTSTQAPSKTTARSSSISPTSVILTRKGFRPTKIITSSESMAHRTVLTISRPSNFHTTTATSAVPNKSTVPELSSGALTGIVIGGLLILLFLMLIIISIAKYFTAERKKSTHWNEASSTIYHAYVCMCIRTSAYDQVTNV